MKVCSSDSAVSNIVLSRKIYIMALDTLLIQTLRLLEIYEH